MLLPLITFAYFALSPLQQPKSLYEQVIANPDPNNGFDDYIRAADVLNDGYADVYFRWRPGAYDRLKQIANDSKQPLTEAAFEHLKIQKQLDDIGYLGVQRAMQTRYARALDFLRQGNQKRVWDPRKPSYDLAQPEGSAMRALVELCEAAAYADFAKGDSRSGTGDMLAGLTLTTNIEPNSLMDYMMGTAWEQMIMDRFSRFLAYLSEPDTRQVIQFVDAQMAKPTPYASALKAYHDVLMASMDKVVGPSSTDPTYQTPTEKFATAMTPQQRQQAVSGVADGIERRYRDVIRLLDGPESQWCPQPQEPYHEDAPVRNMDDYVLSKTLEFATLTRLSIPLRHREQLRLLGLQSRIINFRWHNNRLPASLSEAAPKALTVDPVNDGEFAYEPHPDGTYRLYSRGSAGTGPIEVRYISPKTRGDDQVPPPQGGR